MTCDGGSTIGGGPNYIWSKDNSPVHNGTSYTIQSAGTSDSGSYRCQTSTGEISDPAGLDVIYDWVILQTPLYVYEGDEINITCHHYPGYSGGRTRFYKDNRVIRGWTNNAEYYIGRVDGTTAGTYRCEKEVHHHSLHYKHDDAVSVSVGELLTTPTITVTPQPVFQKDNMTLTCETRLPPARQNTQLRFAFYRDGRIVQDFSINDIYEVYNVQLEHSGKYSCEVETTDGRVRKRSAERLLQIGELFSTPVLKVSPELGKDGANMTLTCVTVLSEHRQDTELRYAFYRDERRVQGFTSSNKYEVQFIPVEDSGTYKCVIQTSTGRVMKKSQELLIEGKQSLSSCPSHLCQPSIISQQIMSLQ
ncbi:hypothetical protein GDO78_019342 [Eleutherodactylus coqui]|uniref:Ig-like domain-containing protein n=1 Tax=Eleutherodactylus coqui TaxID=57060 RepID=A0A8J6BJJ6_ELECQ|nr:hypothetical protein GDO78_019342 [Eleutherodactylus coqui]